MSAEHHGERITEPARLAVYQGWWGLNGLGSRNAEWSIGEKFARLADAGFEGILLFGLPAEHEADRWRSLLVSHGMQLGLGTFTADPQVLAGELERAKEFDVRFLNAQVRDDFVRGDDAVRLLRTFVRQGEEAGIPCLIETHRASVTQDLLRTVDYVRAVPEMTLAADLSHYVVAGQMQQVTGDFGPFPSGIELLLDELLACTASIHGRVSNGHQVQIDIGADASHPAVAHFSRWWSKALASWRARAHAGDVFPFVVELGPPPYSITRPSADQSSAAEISDRWAQGLVLRGLAHSLWDELS